MSGNVTFFDKEGRHYGVLDLVDSAETLFHIRARASHDLKSLPNNYMFTWKDTPVSEKQEALLKVSRCATLLSDNPKVFKMVVIVKSPKDSNHGRGISKAGNENDKVKPVLNLPLIEETVKEKRRLEFFTEEEIEDQSITRLEKERRVFWNRLACEVSCHPVYKLWSLQALNGLIDTEWTLKKTELLKVEVDQLIKKIKEEEAQCQRNDRTSEKEKKLLGLLDRLSMLELKRQNTYKKIEEFHRQLKCSTTDRHLKEEQIGNEETNLDEILTEIKSCQSGLEKSIKYAKIDNDNSDLDNFTEETQAPELTEEEVSYLTQSIFEDYKVEYLSE